MIQLCFLYYDTVSYVVSNDISSYNLYSVILYDIVLKFAKLSNSFISQS